mgnify:CR=1 FL=1
MAKSTAAVKTRKQSSRSYQERLEAFDSYYQELYPERWPALREALLGEGRYEALEEGLLQAYYLDPASAAVARLLPLEADSRQLRLLDACAAPGGKTLVLLQRLQGGDGAQAQLVANERSAGRRARLHRVLQTHVPPELLAAVTVTGHDATRWGLYEQDAYDGILLDVPCSSERHVLQSPRHVREWSPKRSDRLAKQAVAMLAAMIDALRPGGAVVYSTCALTPRENDAVVARVLERRGERVQLLPVELPFGEATEQGVQVLPDRSGGAGPMYAALLRKTPR